MKSLKYSAILWLIPTMVLAQKSIEKEVIDIPMINIDLGVHIPGADLADRFGISSTLGAGFQKKNAHNFYWGVGISALTGSDVKEDNIIDIITADSLDIIDVNGHTASIRFWQRGAHANAYLGKIISRTGPNQNCGFFLQVGIGYLYHKIRIEDIGNQSPQLNAEMRKGYDRLCMGFTSSQMIGYRHFSNNHKVNFFIGLEFIQAFTEDVRQYDYNAQTAYEDKRIDLLHGIKFGWTIPLYEKSDNKYYYY